MSYRYRPSGYRSQPVSNRTSLYLPSDYNVSNFSDDLSDFDRQFKKLLERTEKFTNRVEKLQSTASYIKKGFRRIDSTVTGLRSQRDVIETAFDSIDNRLHNDVGDPPTTEEEWRKFLDAGVLIEKAVELMRSHYRHPKPVFEYSPEDRSPYSFDISSSTSLVSNPHSPSDEQKVINADVKPTDHVTKTYREKRESLLPVLSEETDDTHSSNHSNASKNQTNHSSNTFRSSRIFDEVNEKPKSKFTIADDKTDNSDTPTRRTSFLRTLISNKKKNRPTSMIEKSQTRETESESVIKKNYELSSNIKRNEHQLTNQVQKAKSMNLDDVAKTVSASFQSSAKSSLNTSLNLFHEDNNSSMTSSKKRSSSSSFHEYNPSNRIPLKERLRMKQAAENAAKEKEPEIIPIVPNSALVLRASKLVKAKEKDEKEAKKDESNSLKSRFLRRFRSTKSEHSESNHQAEETSRRRRTRPISDEVTENDLSSMIRERRQSESEEYRRRSMTLNDSRSSRHSSEIKSSRLNSSSDHVIPEDHQQLETNAERNHRKSRALSDDEEVFDPPTMSFSDITSSLRRKKCRANVSDDHDGINKQEDDDIGSVVRRRRRQSRPRNDSDEAINQPVHERSVQSIGGNSTNDVAEKPERNNSKNLLPDGEGTSEVVLRRHKNSTNHNTELMNLNRKSVLILEDEIVPVHTRKELRELVFRSPKRSLDEVSEDEIQINVANDQNLPENIFDRLVVKQKQISEEEIPLLLLEDNDVIDDADLQRLNQLSPPKEATRFFSEDIIEPKKSLDKSVPEESPKFKIVPNHPENIRQFSPFGVTEDVIINNDANKTPSDVSSIKNMLEEFDKINDEMSKELNPKINGVETEQNGIPNENRLNFEDSLNDKQEKIINAYEGKIFQQSSILENTDIAVVTFAKYCGKLVSDISGQIPVDETPVGNVLNSESLQTNVSSTETMATDAVKTDDTQKIMESEKTTSVEPLVTTVNSAVEISTNNADDADKTKSTSLVNDECRNNEQSDHVIKVDASQNKFNVETQAQLTNIHLTSTPKKRLSYREKREAHMKLLNNSLSASLTSLTETDTATPDQVNVDIVTPDQVNVEFSQPVQKSNGIVDAENDVQKDKTCKLQNGLNADTIKDEKSLKFQLKKELRQDIYLKAKDLSLDKSSSSLTFAGEPSKKSEVTDTVDTIVDNNENVHKKAIQLEEHAVNSETISRMDDKMEDTAGIEDKELEIIHTKANVDETKSDTDETKSDAGETTAITGKEHVENFETESGIDDRMNDIASINIEGSDIKAKLIDTKSDIDEINSGADETESTAGETKAITGKDHVIKFETKPGIDDKVASINIEGSDKEPEIIHTKSDVDEMKSDAGEIKVTMMKEHVETAVTAIFDENMNDSDAVSKPIDESFKEMKISTALTNDKVSVSKPVDQTIQAAIMSTKSDNENIAQQGDADCVTATFNDRTDAGTAYIQSEIDTNEGVEGRMEEPIVEKDKETTFVRPVLEKQMSIKEYRRRKLERQGTSETSCSDDSIVERSDMDKSMLSSLADVSDFSEENRTRNKRYSHSRKDLRHVGLTSESSSESENSNVVSPVAEKKSYFEKTFTSVETSNTFGIRRNSSGNVGSESDRRRRYLHRFPHKSVEQF